MTTEALELLQLLLDLERLLAEIEALQDRGTTDYGGAILAEDAHDDARALRQRLLAGLLANLAEADTR